MITLVNEECAINIDNVGSIVYNKQTGELTFNMINHDKILFEKCSYNDFIDFVERINERDRRNNYRNTERGNSEIGY